MTYFSSCCCVQSPFCSSAFLTLLAQEHSLCCGDLGAALNSDVAFFFFCSSIWRAAKEQCIFLGLSNFSPQETLGTSRWVYTFQVDARVFEVMQTAHPLSPCCFHRNSAVIHQTHSVLTWDMLHRDRAWLTLACTVCWWPPCLGNIFPPFIPFLLHPVIPDHPFALPLHAPL